MANKPRGPIEVDVRIIAAGLIVVLITTTILVTFWNAQAPDDDLAAGGDAGPGGAGTHWVAEYDDAGRLVRVEEGGQNVRDHVLVDRGLAPTNLSLSPRPDGTERPVARVVDGHGLASEFVEDELIVFGDGEHLRAAIDRYGATLVSSHTPRGGMPYHVVRFEDPAQAASLAVTRALPAFVPETDDEVLVTALKLLAHPRERLPSPLVLDEGFNGPPVQLTLSSPDARSLLLTYAAATLDGLSVSPNWIGRPASEHLDLQIEPETFLDDESLEFPGGPTGYNQNVALWPSFRAGPGGSEVGVFDAWQAMERTGRLENRVGVVLIDQDFFPDQDYPPFEGLSLKQDANPLNGGDPDDGRHGDLVVKVGFGLPDNGYGTAGPGGPVAEVLLVHTDYTLDGTFQALDAAQDRGIRIASMSYGWWATGVLNPDISWHQEVLGAQAKFEGYREDGMLLFAAAHNQNRNLGPVSCTKLLLVQVTTCQEDAHMVPCEFGGVTCIGGLESGSKARKINNQTSGSNYQAPWEEIIQQLLPNVIINEPLAGEVDLYSPWPLYWNPPGAVSNGWGGGTSAATPFAAGVASLIWASDPGQSADAVEALLLGMAHQDSPSAFVDRTIDAWDPIRSLLCTIDPSLTVTSPTDGASFDPGTPIPFSLTGQATEPVTVDWGTIPGGHLSDQIQFTEDTLAPGTYQLFASIEDACEARVEDERSFTVRETPLPTITLPSGDPEPEPGETLVLQAQPPTGDPCEDVPASAYTWTSDLEGALGTGLRVETALSTPGLHRITLLVATPDCGLRDVVAVTVGEANRPPTARITQPTAGQVVADEQDRAGPHALVDLSGTGN
ncbi:MAG: S8 family serine peptidase, partial [Candidatus Thermoplasmatota archaeon]|nr:S8 family serine peptidase [Candidatus Thermoplasmatota archaeon]